VVFAPEYLNYTQQPSFILNELSRRVIESDKRRPGGRL